MSSQDHNHDHSASDHSHPPAGDASFDVESVRSSLRRVVTTTYLRGFGRIQPNPHDAPGSIKSCHDRPEEGPAVVLHGLAAAVPSTPLHFIGILECGEKIALSRVGFHKSRLQVLFGRCRITCVDLEDPAKDYSGPVRTWDPRARDGSGAIEFPLTLVTHPGKDGEVLALEAGESPEHDRFILYIESLDGASVLLSSRTLIPDHHHHAAPVVAAVAKVAAASESLLAEPVAWQVYASSSCSPNCSNGCPHTMAFGGQISPPTHHA
jgi:hypothetical protein